VRQETRRRGNNLVGHSKKKKTKKGITREIKKKWDLSSQSSKTAHRLRREKRKRPRPENLHRHAEEKKNPDPGSNEERWRENNRRKKSSNYRVADARRKVERMGRATCRNGYDSGPGKGPQD